MSLDGVQLHLVDSVDEAANMMRWLGTLRSHRIGYDTETTGLSPETDRVRLVQISDDHTAWAIPFERWGGVVEELVHKWDGEYDMHNAPYDRRMTAVEGIEIPIHKIHDTRLMGHVLEPTESTALKNQASRHIDSRAALLQRKLDDLFSKNYWDWSTVPIVAEGDAAIYWQYGCLDPILTYQLRDYHYPRVQAIAPQAYDLELAVAWVIERMERRGAKIDRDFTQENSELFLQYVDQSTKWCIDNYGVKPGTNKDIIDILVRETGYEFQQRTDSGALSLDKNVLDDVIRKTGHPLAETVLTRRRIQKLQSTYLRRFLEYSEYDGFLHPHINSIGGSSKKKGTSEGLYGVRTARNSMDTPNLQQLPRKSESNPPAIVVRNCIVARDDDHDLLMCDFDQIEMRVLAFLSQDPGLIGAFHQPDDFFTTLARDMYRDPDLLKKDPRRQLMKNAGYAVSYGAGPEKFGLTAGISTEDAFVFMNQLHAKYPGIKWMQNEVERISRERKTTEGISYVRSPLTGRLHVADDNRNYALVNYLIQGTAAEILKIKLLELDAAGLGQFMILPVHDEVILDVPRTEQPWVIDSLRGIMNDTTLFASANVPITASVAMGKRWGEKQDLELAA